MNWDVTLFYAINSLAGRSATVDQLMLALGQTSSLYLPGTLAFGYWLWLKRREAVIGMAVLGGVFLIGDLVGAQVKHLVGRLRPCHALTGVQQLSGCGGTFSFPSNHAVNTAAAAACLQVWYPATGWVTWPLVAVIGFSRVYVGGHYVSDVLGGWVIGGLFGAGTALLFVRWSIVGSRLGRRHIEESRPAS